MGELISTLEVGDSLSIDGVAYECVGNMGDTVNVEPRSLKSDGPYSAPVTLKDGEEGYTLVSPRGTAREASDVSRIDD